MFTGIVEALGHVDVLAPLEGSGWRLRVGLGRELGWSLGQGESVAVNGVCLTVVDSAPTHLQFDLAEETLKVSTLGGLSSGDPVNLERPLRLETPLGGHLVLGHVDGIGRVAGVQPG